VSWFESVAHTSFGHDDFLVLTFQLSSEISESPSCFLVMPPCWCRAFLNVDLAHRRAECSSREELIQMSCWIKLFFKNSLMEFFCFVI
jgi:hypothetical protein